MDSCVKQLPNYIWEEDLLNFSFTFCFSLGGKIFFSHQSITTVQWKLSLPHQMKCVKIDHHFQQTMRRNTNVSISLIQCKQLNDFFGQAECIVVFCLQLGFQLFDFCPLLCRVLHCYCVRILFKSHIRNRFSTQTIGSSIDNDNAIAHVSLNFIALFGLFATAFQ